MLRNTSWLFTSLIFLGVCAANANELINCEYISGPLSELKETQTGKDVQVGIAECERNDGVEIVTLVYGSPEKCADATGCANDESIPKLKMETGKIDPTAVPDEDKNGKTNR